MINAKHTASASNASAGTIGAGLAGAAAGSAKRAFLAVTLAFTLLTAAILVSSAPSAFAQGAGTEQPLAGAVPGHTTAGDAADAELWRQIRQGAQGTVAGPNKSTGLLIQSQGHQWEQTRNGPLLMYSAWAILGVIMLIALFFAIRGRIRVEHGLSGRTISRFSGIERVAHWLLASSFIVLALTGLNLLFGRTLLIPLIGKESFSAITLAGKFIHNYVAFAFMAALVLVAVLWVAHNFPNRHDIVWLLRGGGFFGGGHPKARKFNAGQKIVFWLVILCGISISLSGWALMNPFQTAMFNETFVLVNSVFGTNWPTDLTPIQEQQYQALWHTIMAVFMTVIVIGHIYIGTLGLEGALSAMTSGEVDINWAREHHSLWVEEVEAKANESAAANDGKLQPAE